jgi:hypothetical protein
MGLVCPATPASIRDTVLSATGVILDPDDLCDALEIAADKLTTVGLAEFSTKEHGNPVTPPISPGSAPELAERCVCLSARLFRIQ